MTTKKATTDKTVTKTSPSSKTIIRDGDANGETHAPATTAGHPARPAVTPPLPAPHPRADSPDANGPGHAQAAAAPPSTETGPAETRPAGVTHHDPAPATLEQLNGQLAAIRGLPQYAELEREITDRIATLSAPLVRE